MYSRSKALFGGVSLVLCTLLLQTTAWAQDPPNPFEAYEGSRRAAQNPTVVPEDTPKKPESSAAMNFAQGVWSFGGTTLFNWTTQTSELIEGGDSSNSTFLFRLAPSAGYFLADRLEVTSSLGLITRRLERRADDTVTQTSFLFDVGARYHHPVGTNASLFGGGALGFYTGSGERNFTTTNDNGSTSAQTEETDLLGLAFNLEAGAGYFLSQNFQLRASLGLLGLLGNESIGSINKDLGSSTFNTGLSVGAFYMF